MTTIGTFSPTDVGGFNGAIRTLRLQVKAAIVPVDDAAGIGDAEYLVFFDRERVGEAWRTSRNGEAPQLRVRLRHESFHDQVEATLRAKDKAGRLFALDWERAS